MIRMAQFSRSVAVKIIALACSFFVWAGDGVAQNLDPVTLHILKSAAGLEISEELVPIAANVPASHPNTALWTDAIAINTSILAEEPSGWTSIARLMEVALILEGVNADSLPLDRLSANDILAMQSAVGFPDVGDLLLYLLNRAPSLRDDFKSGEYTAIRLAPEGVPIRILLERINPPYLGIETDFGRELLDPDRDPVYKDSRERAKTRRLNLSALPHIILAAKAFRAAERVPKHLAVYPLVIAMQVVDRALLADSRDLRQVAYIAKHKTFEALRTYAGTDASLTSEARSIEFRLPFAAFMARLFSDAAVSYASAPVSPDDHVGKLWAAFGEAFSLFAYGAGASQPFNRVSTLIGPDDTLKHAAIFGMFLDHLPTADSVRLGDSSAWQLRVAEVFGAHGLQRQSLTDPDAERDFAVLMDTIGRPDIASSFFMDRIRSVRGQPREWHYFRQLAPFIRDYCYTISFQMSSASGWVRRESERYDTLLDFLDNFNADGQLVRPGEVVVTDGSYVPYPALNPEEDCAVAQAVYGVIDNPMTGFGDPTPHEKRHSIVSGFETWVRSAISRSEPAPSIVPYLKLVWIEWFSQAFEALKRSADMSKFHYRAIDASALTAPDRVQGLLQHPAATSYQKHLIKLFLETRAFLEEMYSE